MRQPHVGAEAKHDEALAAMVNMGFFDVDRVKALLVKHKGDIQRAVAELVPEL